MTIRKRCSKPIVMPHSLQYKTTIHNIIFKTRGESLRLLLKGINLDLNVSALNETKNSNQAIFIRRIQTLELGGFFLFFFFS